ncbi:MAG: hypothetical protein QOE35_2170 [Actinomycetota bacterium]|jgi:DNA-binding ferritin-like protein
MVGAVSTSPPHDPLAALNQVLSEVIDVVQDVKQAHRRVPETHALHTVLDRLFADLGGWARRLVERDEALGVSPLASMSSVAGRKPPVLWRGDASDDEVRGLVLEHLDRLAEHVTAALAEQDDELSRGALAEVERGLTTDREALAAL